MLFFSFVFTFFCIRFCLRQFSRHVILRTCWLLKGSVEGLLSWSFYHSHSSQISHAFAFVRAFPSFPGLVSSVFWHLCFGRELQDVSTECNFHLLSPFGVYAGTLVIQILRFFSFLLAGSSPSRTARSTGGNCRSRGANTFSKQKLTNRTISTLWKCRESMGKQVQASVR